MDFMGTMTPLCIDPKGRKEGKTQLTLRRQWRAQRGPGKHDEYGAKVQAWVATPPPLCDTMIWLLELLSAVAGLRSAAGSHGTAHPMKPPAHATSLPSRMFSPPHDILDLVRWSTSPTVAHPGSAVDSHGNGARRLAVARELLVAAHGLLVAAHGLLRPCR